MIYEHEGRRPRIADSAYVAPNAVVCGDVTIGEDARVLFGAVLTSDGGGPVEVGATSVVMEQAVVRGRAEHPTRIGANVLVGPHAHLNGAQIDDGAFLATGVSVFPGAHVGGGSEVRINGVVHVNADLPAGTTVPIGWVAVGNPAQLFPPDQHEELWEIQRQGDFPGTVFGLPREEASMERIAARYSDLFGEHRRDRRLD
ncbi:gamma carbonic anhydrase family protein [Saccharopolyspora griseoalba]|uniref:Gamma carbonic anhydrase family protein n=1 Tax=Saccharopolyspora griseoalba TaxID=1431848 RepID=A0ABW2LJJ0_9PSEU